MEATEHMILNLILIWVKVRIEIRILELLVNELIQIDLLLH